MTDGSPFHLTGNRRAELRGWALLSIGSLALAGILALLLVLSRTPKIGDLLPWGPTFFYRALVTHVVLSFQVWFLAVLGAFSALITEDGPLRWLGWPGLAAASIGALLLLVPALADQGDPSLNNYVPVLVHPLFYAGLMLHALGVALAALRLLPFLLRISSPAQFTLGCAAASFLIACLCFGLAYQQIPTGTDVAQFTERLFWGGGHVLQILNTLLLIAAWQILSQRQFNQPPLSTPIAAAASGGLLLFAIAAPVIYGLTDILGLAHRQAYTDLLWFGLPLPTTLTGLGLLRLLWRGPRDWRSPAFLSLALSLGVFGLGGVAGFFLGVADTRTPSHYHAVIGGVNLGLMGLFIVTILPAIGRATLPGKSTRLQFQLYGGGQLLHAIGFYLAGAAGVPRKTAGAAQGLDTLWKKVSMGVVGVGGAVAVIGGILFVWMALSRLLARKEADHV